MSSIPVVRTVGELRSALAGWRREGTAIALAPTMGALHAGHVSLVSAARRSGGARVVASIFVNPTQFAPTEDFAKYPRSFEEDCAVLADAGADLVFAPDASEMYPEGFATSVVVAGPARVGLEDAFRPTHFAGVATVVAKLLAQAQPDIAVFGEKDYQQLKVIERMARDLDMPARIVAAPTIREADGLALSSRNRYLSDDERLTAAVVPRALELAVSAIRAGTPITEAMAQGRAAFAAAGLSLDYFEARDAATLTPLGEAKSGGGARLLVAGRVGAVRLIDNMAV